MVSEALSYEMLLDQLYDGVCFVDQAGVITYWNKGAQRITGHSRSDMVGEHIDDSPLQHCDREGHPIFNGTSPLSFAMQNREPLERELYLQHKVERPVPVVFRVTPVLNSVGEAIGGLEVFSDNSSKVNALERIEALEEMALVCPLTGAGNRRYAQMALDNAMEELKRYNWPFGLLFIDIDHFKNINDTYGHHIGDEVLQMVVQALKGTLRSFDFIGRWGGEEFLIILPNITDDILTIIAERCRSAVSESVFQTEGRAFQVTISIGATIPTSLESASECLERADRLMYQSKANGRNRVTTDG